MARILINALASTAGGGITYLRNVLPRLARFDLENQYLVIVPAQLLNDYSHFASERLAIETIAGANRTATRMMMEQTGLKALIRRREMQALVSLGNFAMLASPVPQILFNRNDLLFSARFEADLRQRNLRRSLLAHKLKSWLAKQSIKQATVNVTPTAAFADRIKSHRKLQHIEFETLQFGFDRDGFTSNQNPLPESTIAKLNLNDDCRRLLFVSHYNYFRNFETLIRALPIIKSGLKQQTGENVQLVLTTDIRRGASYGGYDATAAAELIDRLGVRGDIAMLGAVEYDKLHQIYRHCDVFVCPSYSESFGHPLVEAMASGVPVVSADLPVHREICGEAAVYFDVFDENDLAGKCLRALTENDWHQQMKAAGLTRSRQFSWDEHVRQLIALINRVVATA
ncbi:MAG: glycosyltransferase family 4 protein [Blastocatellales bacterium]